MKFFIDVNSLNSQTYASSSQEEKKFFYFNQIKVDSTYQYLKHSKRASILIGGYRGVGKSSFVEKIVEKLKVDFHEKLIHVKIILPQLLDNDDETISSKTLNNFLVGGLYKAFNNDEKNRGISTDVLKELKRNYLNVVYDRKEELSKEELKKVTFTQEFSNTKFFSNILSFILPGGILFSALAVLFGNETKLYNSNFLILFVFLLAIIQVFFQAMNMLFGLIQEYSFSEKEILHKVFNKHTEFQDLSNLLSLLESDGYKVVFVLDESDKLPSDPFFQLVSLLKPYLLDTRATYILITGFYHYLDLSLKCEKDNESVYSSLFNRLEYLSFDKNEMIHRFSLAFHVKGSMNLYSENQWMNYLNLLFATYGGVNRSIVNSIINRSIVDNHTTACVDLGEFEVLPKNGHISKSIENFADEVKDLGVLFYNYVYNSLLVTTSKLIHRFSNGKLVGKITISNFQEIDPRFNPFRAYYDGILSRYCDFLNSIDLEGYEAFFGRLRRFKTIITHGVKNGSIMQESALANIYDQIYASNRNWFSYRSSQIWDGENYSWSHLDRASKELIRYKLAELISNHWGVNFSEFLVDSDGRISYLDSNSAVEHIFQLIHIRSDDDLNSPFFKELIEHNKSVEDKLNFSIFHVYLFIVDRHRPIFDKKICQEFYSSLLQIREPYVFKIIHLENLEWNDLPPLPFGRTLTISQSDLKNLEEIGWERNKDYDFSEFSLISNQYESFFSSTSESFPACWDLNVDSNKGFGNIQFEIRTFPTRLEDLIVENETSIRRPIIYIKYELEDKDGFFWFGFTNHIDVEGKFNEDEEIQFDKKYSFKLDGNWYFERFNMASYFNRYVSTHPDFKNARLKGIIGLRLRGRIDIKNIYFY